MRRLYVPLPLSVDFLTCETFGIICTLFCNCDSRRNRIYKSLGMTGKALMPGQLLKDEIISIYFRSCMKREWAVPRFFSFSASFGTLRQGAGRQEAFF